MNFILTRIFACVLILCGYIVTRRSTILRITFGIFWMFALGGGSVVSQAQRSPALLEKKPEQVMQSINFGQPEPLFSCDTALFGQKPGVAYPLASRYKEIPHQTEEDRAAKRRLAPSESQFVKSFRVGAMASYTARVCFLFLILRGYNGDTLDAQELETSPGCTRPPCLAQTISIESSNTTTYSVLTIAPSGESICIMAIGLEGMNQRKRPSFSSSSISLRSQE